MRTNEGRNSYCIANFTGKVRNASRIVKGKRGTLGGQGDGSRSRVFAATLHERLKGRMLNEHTQPFGGAIVCWGRIVSTGHAAFLTIRSAVLPKSMCSTPLCPWVATTIMSTWRSSASARIS